LIVTASCPGGWGDISICSGNDCLLLCTVRRNWADEKIARAGMGGGQARKTGGGGGRGERERGGEGRARSCCGSAH
jgi:hypothetical protein